MKRHILYIGAVIALLALFSFLQPVAQIADTQLHLATVNGGNAEYVAMQSADSFPWGILKALIGGTVIFFYVKPYLTEQK
jgi:hypothetical protein